MNEVDEQVEQYTPPVLVEVGEFDEDTLGVPIPLSSDAIFGSYT